MWPFVELDTPGHFSHSHSWMWTDVDLDTFVHLYFLHCLMWTNVDLDTFVHILCFHILCLRLMWKNVDLDTFVHIFDSRGLMWKMWIWTHLSTFFVLSTDVDSHLSTCSLFTNVDRCGFGHICPHSLFTFVAKWICHFCPLSLISLSRCGQMWIWTHLSTFFVSLLDVEKCGFGHILSTFFFLVTQCGKMWIWTLCPHSLSCDVDVDKCGFGHIFHILLSRDLMWKNVDLDTFCPHSSFS